MILQRTGYKCIIVDIAVWNVVFFSYIVILLFVKENKIMHIWVLCEHSMDENAYNNINNNVFISVFFQSFPWDIFLCFYVVGLILWSILEYKCKGGGHNWMIELRSVLPIYKRHWRDLCCVLREIEKSTERCKRPSESK